VAQVERLLARVRAIHAGLTDRADRLDAKLDENLAVLRGEASQSA
jgi:hypothetical protein